MIKFYRNKINDFSLKFIIFIIKFLTFDKRCE